MSTVCCNSPAVSRNPDLLDRQEAAGYIGVQYQTLCSWATLGRGPRFLKVGRLVKYRRADLDRWLESCVTGGAGV